MGGTDIGKSGQKLIDWTELKCMWSDVKQRIAGSSGVGGRGRVLVNSIVRTLPCISWMPNYKRKWLMGDLISGLTVGVVVLPQSLAYAKIAGLPPEYGLYTAVAGVLIYPFFSTSKDVNVGPSSVLSLLTCQLISAEAFNTVAGSDNLTSLQVSFAICLGFLSGLFQLLIGVLRMGMIVDMIPSTVITGFTSGAAVAIIISQIPNLLGIRGIDVNQLPPYMVVYKLFANITGIGVDAAIGMSCLVFLVCVKAARRKWGGSSRIIYYIGISGNGIAVVCFTLASYLITRYIYNGGAPSFSLIGDVPRGLRDPSLDFSQDILSRAAVPALSIAIIAMVEHVAIAKSFGAKNNYAVDCSQEIFALGLTNFGGSLLGSYPMTGSFTRSAIKVSSGVNSPADGIFTSAIVLGALYFLTPVFYFIPTAILPAIIIVSISDLIASYPVFIEMWNISIAEFLICLTGMIMTILSTIANGIYTSLALCLLLLLYRLSCPRISLLEKHFAGVSQFTNLNCPPFSLTTTDFTNCIVLRVEESIMFLNAATVVDVIMQFVRKHVNVMGAGSRMADTSASPDSTVCIEHDSGGGGGKQPKRKQTIGNVYPVIKGRLSKDNINNSVQQSSFSASYLRSLVFDFSSVNMLDATAVHALRCLRNQLTQHLFPNKDMNVDLDCWSSNNTLPDTLEFHFVHVKPHLHRIVVNLLIPQIADIQGSSDITNLANLEQVASRYIHPDLETALEVARCVV